MNTKTNLSVLGKPAWLTLPLSLILSSCSADDVANGVGAFSSGYAQAEYRHDYGLERQLSQQQYQINQDAYNWQQQQFAQQRQEQNRNFARYGIPTY